MLVIVLILIIAVVLLISMDGVSGRQTCDELGRQTCDELSSSLFTLRPGEVASFACHPVLIVNAADNRWLDVPVDV